MNKNKIIFIIIWLVLLGLIFLAVINLNSWSDPKTKVKKDKWTFTVWTFWDDKTKFLAFLNEFKKTHPVYSSYNFVVENFSDYEDYFYSLTSAFNKQQWPDLFVLNWNEKSVLQNQALYIDSDIISVNDFRRNYKWVFSDELIYKADNNKEYLIWIPVWYETLWVFYNRRYFSSDDLETWEWVDKVISDLSINNRLIIPLWMWNWSTVDYSYDILTQFFLLDSIESISKLSWQNITQAFSLYQKYWDISDKNWYNSLLPVSSPKNNIELFSNDKIWAIIWYPRTLFDIDKYWYWKAFLLATPFPRYAVWWTDYSFVNFNYFSVNSDSINQDLWMDILKYMTTKEWASVYLNNFPYYLPAMIDLEWYVMEEKILDKYNIVYRDFYNSATELKTFNKWIKNIYDKEVVRLLDTPTDNQVLFENFKNILVCKTKKALTLTNLSTVCK